MDSDIYVVLLRIEQILLRIEKLGQPTGVPINLSGWIPVP